jgi:D-sedoheptulose 7-phosphate isomerase|tara:strand:+ start:3069 stop:3725 length:657 start_codon:yes stop_codon:yes gene_type:complete
MRIGVGSLSTFLYFDEMDELQKLALRSPELSHCLSEIEAGAKQLISCFQQNHKLLLCGNGGSCADCEHIAGELVKQFSRTRPLSAELVEKLGPELSQELHGGLPALSLPSMIGFHTAFNNDDKPEYAFAQQVVAFGQPGDVLMGISTSGNSKNIIKAAEAARALGLKVLSLTGQDGGVLATLADIAIKAPATEVARVQELHLPIYHSLCQMVEDTLFP